MPARVAIETSLRAAEAYKMLKELAECGHLEVRVCGDGLFYAFWEDNRRFAPGVHPAKIQ
jgi:hypothetical protein